MIPKLSIVVPMFNESASLSAFFGRLIPILEDLNESFEVVCVDDGSRDDTLEQLVQINSTDSRVKVVALSRNFGKERALTAGLDAATGCTVIPIDADLQDPPELIPQMLEEWRRGYDVVLAIRSDRSSDSFMKRLSANSFYRVLGRLSEVEVPANAGDYRLMDRQVVDALQRLPERTRFMKGLFAWLGFRQTKLYFKREERSAGDSKWGSWKLWNLALEGIFSFSTAPLRIWTYLGLLLSSLSIFYLIYVVVDTLLHGNEVPGYPSLVAISLFFNGAILMGLGIVGEYVGRIFVESKQRPIYLVRERIGFDDGTADNRLRERESPTTKGMNSSSTKA